MSIWKCKGTLKELNDSQRNTMVEYLGMEVTAMSENTLTMTMPIDHRTKQLYGIMHGGASAALAETAGSIAANLCLDPSTYFAVGLDINTSHIRQVREGHVKGVAEAIHLGKTTQIWQIKIYDAKGNLASLSRLTMAVLPKRDT